MSIQIIEASPDLRRLRESGFEVRIKSGYLLVSSVPYLNSAKQVARGTLVMALNMATDILVGQPKDHVAFFAGEVPHYADGIPMKGIINSLEHRELDKGILVKMTFSSKPEVPDPDYEAKVCRYVDTLSTPARVLDPNVTAQTRAIVVTTDEELPFLYPDTNSARAQITNISNKLSGSKIAIVGCGGTGSYILDLVAKTPVKEIHLFDDDDYALHNAYRSPGAPTIEQLRARMLKVDYLKEVYSRMRRGIVTHPECAGPENLDSFAEMGFIFLCMDPGPAKASLVAYFIDKKIPFVDTGLGVEIVSDKLIGMVNLLTFTPAYHGHLNKIPIKEGGKDDLYASNIQIAELNMLNAVMAVIKWKKLFGFYLDERGEHECSFTIGSNMLINEETGA